MKKKYNLRQAPTHQHLRNSLVEVCSEECWKKREEDFKKYSKLFI